MAAKHRRPRHSQPLLADAAQALYWLLCSVFLLNEHWHWF